MQRNDISSRAESFAKAAQTLLDTKEYRGAILLFSKAIESASNEDKVFLARAYTQRFLAYQAINDHEKAKMDLLKIAELTQRKKPAAPASTPNAQKHVALLASQNNSEILEAKNPPAPPKKKKSQKEINDNQHLLNLAKKEKNRLAKEAEEKQKQEDEIRKQEAIAAEKQKKQFAAAERIKKEEEHRLALIALEQATREENKKRKAEKKLRKAEKKQQAQLEETAKLEIKQQNQLPEIPAELAPQPEEKIPALESVTKVLPFLVIKTVDIPNPLKTPLDEKTPSALEVIQLLQQNGHQVFLIGGTSRNLWLEKPLDSDFDIITDANQNDLIKIFKGRGIAPNPSQPNLYNFNGHTKKLGAIDLWTSTILADKKIADPLQAEIMSRDFKCSAIPVRLNNDTLEILGKSLDIYHDIHVVLNTVIPAKNSFKDPIKLLRAFYFQAKLKVKLSVEIKEAIALCKIYLRPDFKPDVDLMSDPHFKATTANQLNFWLQNLLFNRESQTILVHLTAFGILEQLFPNEPIKSAAFDSCQWLATSLLAVKDNADANIKKTLCNSLNLSDNLAPEWPITLFYIHLLSTAVKGMNPRYAANTIHQCIETHPLLKLTVQKDKNFLATIQKLIQANTENAAGFSQRLFIPNREPGSSIKNDPVQLSYSFAPKE